MNNVLELATRQNSINRAYLFIESADPSQLLGIIQAVADRLAEIDEEVFEDPIRALDDALDEAGAQIKNIIERADRHPRFCKCIECETAAADTRYNILMDNKDRA